MNGPASFNRKADVAAQIGSFTVIGSSPAAAYANYPFRFAWSDGAPLAMETGAAAGVYVVGQNNGFVVTAPASNMPQTLIVYAGVYEAQAIVTAQSSDASAPAYQDASTVNFSGRCLSPTS